MIGDELLSNLALLIGCYLYVFLVIVISGKIENFASVSAKLSRKFLHMMIGILPLLIPLFTYNHFPLNFPFFVAAPFIIVTIFASPYSPSKQILEKMGRLGNITEGGHKLGLLFYSISYSILALLFSTEPTIIAAGIFPMAFGDATAALIGERYGRHRFNIFSKKSVEGSSAMFLISFLSISISLFYFQFFYQQDILVAIVAALGTAFIAAIAEILSPLGFDNLTVPILSALTFWVLIGGI